MYPIRCYVVEMPIFHPNLIITLHPFIILNSGSHDFPAVDSLATPDVSSGRKNNKKKYTHAEENQGTRQN